MAFISSGNCWRRGADANLFGGVNNFKIRRCKTKHKKKKKREKRKLRKQKRKQKQQPFKKWLTDDLNKEIWKIAKTMTKHRKYPDELLNKKFYCKTCKKPYCICFDGTIQYCDTCCYNQKPETPTPGCTWVGCIKEINDIRDCEQCNGA